MFRALFLEIFENNINCSFFEKEDIMKGGGGGLEMFGERKIHTINLWAESKSRLNYLHKVKKRKQDKQFKICSYRIN